MVAHQLREEGIGEAVRHTEVFFYEEEGLLWSRGCLGVASPRSLFDAVFL